MPVTGRQWRRRGRHGCRSTIPARRGGAASRPLLPLLPMLAGRHRCRSTIPSHAHEEAVRNGATLLTPGSGGGGIPRWFINGMHADCRLLKPLQVARGG
uniref:Uncharacterized protein n=1 Tax=Oryza sativa subsp. japonica TaxID=39947 RepID=Q6YUY2_ORYSJ|nr:hypothetical protein [Oryza sativa Japonica Group]BAD16438.1 hypothetical protein [Oryza sativa Japonica Group]